VLWFWVVVLVALIGAIAVVAAGRGDAMSEVYDDRPDAALPAGRPLTAEDLRTLRLTTGVRGYRMDEVDALLARLEVELIDRDGAERVREGGEREGEEAERVREDSGGVREPDDDEVWDHDLDDPFDDEPTGPAVPGPSGPEPETRTDLATAHEPEPPSGPEPEQRRS
jgi:DivIVA domain-containing protein